jgi:hypothetical protein
MVWNGDWEMDEYLEHVRTAGYEALLGFNEPDGEGTNHLSVDDALALWPRLEATGLRLGGPACAEVTPWLDEFMAKAKAQGRRVDFVCAHWYGDITKPDPVGDLRFFLEAFWKEFRLPIWLTEFSGANIWDRTPTVEDNARFVAEAIPMLESLPFLERYAWFAPLSPATDRNYPTVALCRPDGSFTPVGTAYREAG